jgi:prepilin-type N-terminal cleavage/methylation domain-containing protein
MTKTDTRPAESNARARRRARGFTLIELLITVAVIIVIAGIALIGYGAVMRAINEKMLVAKMGAVGSAANTFRSSSGQGRYPTLQELTTRQPGQTSALVPDLTPDAAGVIHYKGWQIQVTSAPTDKTFAVVATPDGVVCGAAYKNCYLVFEDGVVRKTSSGDTADRTASPVKL